VRNWNGQCLIRISIAAYNTADDLSALADGLGKLF
jgi:selenocysteine lyase/cysteine desulfurase